MSRKSVFTTITPLPSTITRETAYDALHDHILMIDLNPLVIDRKLVPKAPHFASAEEYNCKWYLITDRISYMPGRMVTGKVDYYACFHDLPDGIQTHVFAPMGLDIRSRWRIGGTLPGEPRETTELGLGIPKEGLYIREDVTMKCNIMLTTFVKKTFKKAHERLVDRLGEKTHVTETTKHNAAVRMSGAPSGYRVSSTNGSSPTSTPSYPPTMPGSPPLSHPSPRFSAQQMMRPESPAPSHMSGPSPYYGSPMLAAQMAAQGIDPNNPAHQPYISPLFNQVDPAYRAANPYESSNHSQQYLHQQYDPSVHGDMKMGYQQQGYYPPPLQQQHGQQGPQYGAVEIASSELQHPALRSDGKPPPIPAKVPQTPAEMEG